MCVANGKEVREEYIAISIIAGDVNQRTNRAHTKVEGRCMVMHIIDDIYSLVSRLHPLPALRKLNVQRGVGGAWVRG